MAEVYDLDDEMTQMEEGLRTAEITAKDFQQPLSLLEPREPLCVESGTPIAQAVRLLIEKKVGCVLVTKNKKLAGMLTERQIVMKLTHDSVDLEKTIIDDYMIAQPKALKLSDPIIEVLRYFVTEQIRHVPIINEHREPVGYTSVRGMINYIVSFFTEDVLNLPPNPLRFGASQADGA